jgi:glycosyltransferase involved in cell wall biosynthesis
LSESEGVPVSIMEAQSFGIPVIATNVGGTSEIVNERVGILLSDNPTRNDVCKALEEVLKSNISREFIKKEWNKISNAERNFSEFASELIGLR